MFVLPAARVGADPRVCPNNNESLPEKFFKNLFQNLSKYFMFNSWKFMFINIRGAKTIC